MNTAHFPVCDVPIDLLEPHPENSNFMDAETLQKLRRHIEETGRYEPLTVRPHPQRSGSFQVINGHNRLKVLRALQYTTVHCTVWNLDDQQARLYLATLNRLSGNDIPERRAALLENLLSSFTVDELSLLLPDDRKQLEELEKLSRLEIRASDELSSGEDRLGTPVILSFMLEEPDARKVNLALDLVLSLEAEISSRGSALVHLSQFYVAHRRMAGNE